MFKDRPLLLFWEVTRACLLSCVHCRASAILDPLPGELSEREGVALIESITKFGSPLPVLVLTGGDPLRRSDIFSLIKRAAELGFKVAVSPAVTELLTSDALRRFARLEVSAISVSLDGASEQVHDAIRRRDGTYRRTLEAIKVAKELGINLQVNTAVMQQNLMQLPEIFHLIRNMGVDVWEVFFLVKVGRGEQVHDLSAIKYESVCNFLYDASCYDVMLRVVEAPFIRRVAQRRIGCGDYWDETTYLTLRKRLIELEGHPQGASTIRLSGTLDGDGVIFVAHDGEVYPGGFLQVSLGNVRHDDIVEIYRDNELLRRIRERRFNGRCGSCVFKNICGGSRARAYAYTRDPLGSDPACVYVASESMV